MGKFSYVLGYSRDEAARLRAQARLWDPVSHQLFDRLGVGRGWKVLEIGPGQGSLHLELRRRVKGPVDAVERSAAVAEQLTRRVRRHGSGEGRLWISDLAEADLPDNTYDLIFARWVFLFLPDAAGHVQQLTRALKPGGRLAIQDYHRDTFTLVPRPPEWLELMGADRAFFATQGGTASVGPLLPTYFRDAGLKTMDVTLTVKSGHPGSPVWNWLTTYFMGVMDRLGTLPPLSPAKAAQLKTAWTAAGRDRSSLLVGPALLDVVGVKPRRRRGR